MLIAENRLFNRVLDKYSYMMPRFSNARKWQNMSEIELWQELCLCILSSNVPYELAKSAFRHLNHIGYLNPKWITETLDSRKIIAKQLQEPLYLPRKIDGSLRKYRFPNARSKDIFEAAKVVSSEENWLLKVLLGACSEIEVRNILVGDVPGLGLKEASHFLRNIKYSNGLAIIDSHVVSFLAEINVVPKQNTKTITRKTYLDLEGKLKEICESHNLSMSVFDMAIWACMREDGR